MRKKIIALVVIVVILIATLSYFYYLGEDFKRQHSLKEEAGLYPTEAIIGLALIFDFTEKKPGVELPLLMTPEISASEFVEAYATSDSMKTKCLEATQLCNQFHKNIESENSFSLGLNRLIFESSGNSINLNLEGAESLSSSFYGFRECLIAINSCFDELN